MLENTLFGKTLSKIENNITANIAGHTIKGRDSRWEFIETRRHYSSINVKFSQTRNSCELRLELSVKIVGL